MPATGLPDELKPLARSFDNPRPNVLLVIGAGISMGATGDPRAGWEGLLLDAVDTAERLGASTPETAAYERGLIAEAFTGDFQLDEILQRAERITKRLGGVDSPRFGEWLQHSVGALKALPEHFATLARIAALVKAGAIVLTTNYDSLLSDATGLEPVTWEEAGKILEVLNRRRKGIIHIHGHWTRPSSVILGRASYARLRSDDNVQTELKSLWLQWHWLYLGCGSGGLDDPNMGALLRWAHEAGFGTSALEDYLLTTDDTLRTLPEYLGHSEKLIRYAYGAHKELPEILAQLAPGERAFPFLRIGAEAPRVRREDESPLSSPFPSWKEYVDGTVPPLAVDEEVVRRLEEQGWAMVLDVASVGKTTLAYRIAARPEYRDAAYHLLLSQFPNSKSDIPPEALARLARPGALLVIDDAHHAPELAHALWQRWREQPAGSRLLILSTLVERQVTMPGQSALRVLENDPVNAAVALKTTAADLAAIGDYVLTRVDGTEVMLKASEEVLARWYRSFGREVGAFVVAVSQRQRELLEGDFSLPESAAADWMRERYLRELPPDDVDNVVCLSLFADQNLELDVPKNCLPHPSAIDSLQASGLVVRVNKRIWLYGLREHGWGRLALATMEEGQEVPRIAILARTAAKDVFLALATALRLRSRRPKDAAAFWSELAKHAEVLGAHTPKAGLKQVADLIKRATQADETAVVDAMWRALEAHPDQLLRRVLETPAGLEPFVDTARKHHKDDLIESLWERLATTDLDAVASRNLSVVTDLLRPLADYAPPALLERFFLAVAANPERLIEQIFGSPLSTIGILVNMARKSDRTGLAESVWDILAAQPERAVEHTLASGLNDIGAFLATAADHDRKDVAATIWRRLAEQPGRLAERVLASSLNNTSAFVSTAVGQQRWDVVRLVWRALEADPAGFGRQIVASSLTDLGTFASTAAKQGQAAVASLIWQTVAANQSVFWKRIEGATLGEIVTFLRAIGNQKQKDLAETFWNAIAADVPRFAQRALDTTLIDVRPFVILAVKHGRTEVADGMWATLSAHPDRLAVLAAEQTPQQLMSFLASAPESVVAEIIGRLQPEDWAWSRARDQRFSDGAPGLARLCGNLGRDDVERALVDNILRRQCADDFSDWSSALIELSRLTGLIVPEQQPLFEDLVGAVCRERWLGGVYSYTKTIPAITGSLHAIVLTQPPAIIQRFRHKNMAYRLSRALLEVESLDQPQLSEAIQFLAVSQLVGSPASRPLLARMPVDRVGTLPAFPPHAPEAVTVERGQRQLWMGLRVVASTASARLFVDRGTIDTTLALWRRNLEGTDEWPGTKERPGTTAHRIDASMVHWLESCASGGKGQLLPHREPLWMLAGFTASRDVA